MDPCNHRPHALHPAPSRAMGWVAPIMLAVLAGACGGGGSGPTTPPAPPPTPPPPPTTIDIPAGRAALGLVSAGEVRFLGVAAGGEETELAVAETGDDGRFAEREVETDHAGPFAHQRRAERRGRTSRYLCDLLDGCTDRDGVAGGVRGNAAAIGTTLSAAMSSPSAGTRHRQHHAVYDGGRRAGDHRSVA